MPFIPILESSRCQPAKHRLNSGYRKLKGSAFPHAVARARAVQRGPGAGEEVRPTAYAWLIELRTFFSDICAWATEPDSPFAPFAPRTIPITRHTLLGHGFEKALARTRARITATVLDLEREMPKTRALALPMRSPNSFDGKVHGFLSSPRDTGQSYTGRLRDRLSIRSTSVLSPDRRPSDQHWQSGNPIIGPVRLT